MTQYGLIFSSPSPKLQLQTLTQIQFIKTFVQYTKICHGKKEKLSDYHLL